MTAIITLAALFAQPANAAPPQCNETVRTVVDELFSGIVQQETRVLADPTEFCDAWDDIYSFVYPPPPCNANLIDWTSEIGIMVGIGWRPDTCFEVELPCVHRTATDVIGVGVREIRPGPYCLCFDSLVQPVEIIAVQTPVTNVRFQHRTALLECSY